MEQFINFIAQWGYVAVFLGAMVEGESVILTASYLAYKGILSFPIVMGVAFVGTFCADQALFFLGRHYGTRLLHHWPHLEHRMERPFALLRKWGTWYIMTFRFIYGVRIISSVVIGMSGIPPRRFLGLNFISGVVWAVISCGAGYLIGDGIEWMLQNFDLWQKYMFGGFAIMMAALYWFVFRGPTHRKKRGKK